MTVQTAAAAPRLPLAVRSREWAFCGLRPSLDADGVRMVMHAASVERRRALARALHEAPRVDARFASLHVAIVLYRERAATLFRRLVELEAEGNDNVAEIRRAVVACSELVETLATAVGAPGALWRGYDWIDAPTLPRRRP